MTDGTPPNLDAIGAPIAAALLPGWEVTWTWATQDELDADIPGAMAICHPTPTRQLAAVRVVQPWPSSESLAETLWHELTHALLSPLTALIPASDGAVMVEEQAVERLGKLLSTLPPRSRRAVVRGVERWAPGLRARISARAGLARDGGTMDGIAMLLAGLKAALTAEDPKPIIEQLITEAEKLNPGSPEPDGDELPTEGDGGDMNAKKIPPAAAPPADEGSGMARARKAIEGELARARAARKSIIADAIGVKIERARTGGFNLSAEDERDLQACETTEAADKLLGVMKRHAQPPRGRSGAEPATKEKTSAEKGDPVADVEAAHEVKVSSLRGREATTYQTARARGAAHAKASLDGIARARKSRGVPVATGEATS